MEPPWNHHRTSITLTEPSWNPHETILEHHRTSQLILIGIGGIHTRLTQNPENYYQNICKILDSHKKDKYIT